MKKDQIREPLQKLYDQLNNTYSSDKQTQERIQALKSDVQKVLEEMGEFSPGEHQGVLANLRSSVEHFEGSHPELTSLLNDVITTISNWGI
jgi:tRNA C32,U32 (ribose-2'-O)-methylase TrmJ